MKQHLNTALIAFGIVVLTVAGVRLAYGAGEAWKRRRALVNEYTVTVPSTRGDILGADGEVLATNRTVYRVRLDCTVMEDSLEWQEKAVGLAASLAAFLPKRDSAAWQVYLQEGRQKGKKYLPITDGLTGEQLAQMRTFPLLDMHPYEGGAVIERRSVRDYPFGRLGCRVIGRYHEDHGAYGGLEESFDSHLRGENGEKRVLTGHYEGRVIRKEKELTPVHDGETLHTTLSMRWQTAADSLIREAMGRYGNIESGCLVLMEVSTGAVRAMANLTRKDSEPAFREVENLALTRLIEPGSVASLMTLAAIMEDGFLPSLKDEIPTNHGMIAHLMRDARIADYERSQSAHRISVEDGFLVSSNYVSSYLAGKYYPDDAGTLAAHILSYNPSFECDVRGRQDFRIGAADAVDDTAATVKTLALGYGFRQTPLALLSFYNAVANGGVWVRPHLVKGSGRESRRILPESVADSLSALLRDSRHLTAGRSGNAIIRIAAGGRGAYHTADGQARWAGLYAGSFPAGEPQYSVVCVYFSGLIKEGFFGEPMARRTAEDLAGSLNQ